MSGTNAASGEFLLKEYDALMRKLDLFAQEQFTLARWAVIFTAIFWSYLAVKQPGWLGLAYWTPAIVVVLLGMRTLSLLLAVKKVQKYLLSIESYMELPAGLGWEKLKPRQKTAAIRTLCWLYWVLLLVINMGIVLFYIPMLQRMG
jgi:hypothetical protein